MKKKEIPLLLVRGIRNLKIVLREKVSNFEGVKIISDTNTSMKIIDEDENSDFYFEVADFKLSDNKPAVKFTYKPYSERTLGLNTGFITVQGVESYFMKWLDLIQEYNNISLSPDEKILKAYEEEFFAEFEIIDEDADEIPFDLNQQLYLDKYLGAIEEFLENKGDETILPILEETRALRENLTNQTKKSVIRKLSKILSKIRKRGLNFLKEVYTETKKQALKKLIDGSLDGIENLLT